MSAVLSRYEGEPFMLLQCLAMQVGANDVPTSLQLLQDRLLWWRYVSVRVGRLMAQEQGSLEALCQSLFGPEPDFASHELLQILT